MKKITLLIAFACLTTAMQAKIYVPGDRTFYPARIILQDGESFECLVRIPTFPDNAVFYKMDASSKVIKQTLKQRDEPSPIRYILFMPVDDEPFLIEYIRRIDDIDNVMKKKPKMYNTWNQVLIAGPVSLYTNYFGTSGTIKHLGAVHYVAKREGEHGVPMYYKNLTVENFRRKPKERKNKNFHKYAAAYFADYPELAEKIVLKLPGYETQDIVEIVREYNAKMSTN
ncbi:MAG: hypothetical protein LBH22_06255 [Bacteroidales bacterium]|jgi:hypothetical protein|nr:hypothetical protein [Bacteroidales bacterium]